jgi:hypothetical protein
MVRLSREVGTFINQCEFSQQDGSASGQNYLARGSASLRIAAYNQARAAEATSWPVGEAASAEMPPCSAFSLLALGELYWDRKCPISGKKRELCATNSLSAVLTQIERISKLIPSSLVGTPFENSLK